jgi:tetratricopeptide (TPR) repeat protein
MVRTLLILTILVLFAPAGALPQTASTTDQVPLAKALEGLAPGPRIAYLEYLLKAGSTDPEVYFQLGVAFYDGEKPDSALIYYAKAAALAPGLSKAYVNMGVLLDAQHRPQEALSMFEKGIEANPRDLLAHAHAAYLLFDDAQYETAWSHLSKAIAIDSLHPQPHYYLAIFFWKCGMFRESLVEWENVVRLAPGSEIAKKAEENITVLQEALSGPAGEVVPAPRQ